MPISTRFIIASHILTALGVIDVRPKDTAASVNPSVDT